MIITIRVNCYSYSLVDEHLTRNGIWTKLPLVPDTCHVQFYSYPTQNFAVFNVGRREVIFWKQEWVIFLPIRAAQFSRLLNCKI